MTTGFARVKLRLEISPTLTREFAYAPFDQATGACGDVVRNVTGCPVAGVDHDEIVDASPLVLEASQLLAGNAEFYNLPRKFKISITGCRVWCPYPEINDVGLTARRQGDLGGWRRSFHGGAKAIPMV